jgi:hypothetical protein
MSVGRVKKTGGPGGGGGGGEIRLDIKLDIKLAAPPSSSNKFQSSSSQPSIGG